jgi:two-component system, chemotaxis family, chemotaxis protein CheY
VSESGLKILVVDDSSTMRRILRMSLARCGYSDVEEAGDGNEGLALCQAKQFDLIMTDWNMPNMDGLQMILQLRALPAYATAPIVMVTTEGAKDDVIEALTRGATSYIVKPFTPETLKEKLQEVMKT